MPALDENARAKVNLSLRVVGRRVDGYHDLESVVAFADCADRLSLTPGSATAACDYRAAGAGLRRDIGQSRVQGSPAARRARAGSCARRFRARQGAAGRGRDRRRLGGCRRGAAAVGAGERSCHRRCAPDRGRKTDRRRRAGLPRLARLRHDRRRRNAVAARAAENSLRDGQSARGGRDQRRVQRAGSAQRRTPGGRDRCA